MGHWVARDICAALYKQGLGGDPMPLIVRTVAVPKSAFASPGERPDPRVHVDSLSVDREHVEKFGLLTPTKFTLVDDVITRGATLIGAATVLRAAFPGAEVRAFALLRTRGLVEDIEKILDPCGTDLASMGICFVESRSGGEMGTFLISRATTARGIGERPLVPIGRRLPQI